jgi:hypothetical protein
VTVEQILAILATALQILANVNAKKSFVVLMTARNVPMAITIIPTASLVTALPMELSMFLHFSKKTFPSRPERIDQNHIY